MDIFMKNINVITFTHNKINQISKHKQKNDIQIATLSIFFSINLNIMINIESMFLKQ